MLLWIGWCTHSISNNYETNFKFYIHRARVREFTFILVSADKLCRLIAVLVFADNWRVRNIYSRDTMSRARTSPAGPLCVYAYPNIRSWFHCAQITRNTLVSNSLVHCNNSSLLADVHSFSWLLKMTIVCKPKTTKGFECNMFLISYPSVYCRPIFTYV